MMSVLFGLVLLTAAVGADENGPSADIGAHALSATVRLEAAEAAYESLDFDKARAELTLLLAEELTPREQLIAHLLAGQVAVVLDREVEAHGHFVWVLSQDPKASLPLDAPAKVRVAFELVQTELSAVRPPVASSGDAPEPAPSPTPAPVPASAPRIVPDRFVAGATAAAVGTGAVCLTSCGPFGFSTLTPAAPVVAALAAPVAVAGSTAIGARVGNVSGVEAFWPGVAATALGTTIVGVYVGASVYVLLSDPSANTELFLGAIPVGAIAGAAAGLTFGLLLPEHTEDEESGAP